ncbi:MAG: arginine--tRNA ligase [Acholeplasmatales bacterium]|nr:MAG: arginine--tRNA ligase [Acholeplasmatales bacterium]
MQIDMMIKTLIETALKQAQLDTWPDIEIEVPNDTTNGDYATNIAMKLARVLRRAPLAIAESLVANMPDNPAFKHIEVARPGFINFYVDKRIYRDVIGEVLQAGADFGASTIGADRRVNIEFVSANPTGSLHIGHARGAAAGDALARIMQKAGFNVTREYYVNDGGNQINQLVRSIDVRYRQALGETITMPEDGYHGPEIIVLAKQLVADHGDRFLHEDGGEQFRQFGVNHLLAALRADLETFRVHFDVWFSEATLYENKTVEATIEQLKASGHTYEEEGALWLKTSHYGDEKDRVIVKSDGSYTYLLPDIAYHADKLSRGFEQLIDILGSDHHGYVPRLKAAIQMVGGGENALEVELLQMVKVLQNGEELKMSKRSGKAITLRDLIDEVGVDPIRYFFAMRSLNTHMELDLDLALKESNENPVFYAQYAHARIASILRNAAEKSLKPNLNRRQFETLQSDKALELLAVLVDYPLTVELAASKRLPHKITQYIQRLAQAFHTFYASETVISEDAEATEERLVMLHAVKTVMQNALELVGVEAKERM